MVNPIFKNSYFTVLIASFLLTINLLQAQTNVSGNITTNTTWTKAASPYNLTSNVIVDNGATLTIEPGVVVEAKGHIYLSVLGKIIAVGTEADSIYFKGNGVKGFWTGIKIRNTGGSVLNADYTYASGSKFSYVSVADADLGVYIFNNSFFIEKSNFRNNVIACEHRATTISIIKNSIFYNNTKGSYINRTPYEARQDGNNASDDVGLIVNLKLDNCDFIQNGIAISGEYESNSDPFDGFVISNSKFDANKAAIELGKNYVFNIKNILIEINKFINN